MANTSWATVYGVMDGEKVVYVGVTIQDVRQRISSHISHSLANRKGVRTPWKFHNWLRDNHNRITVRVLEICPRDSRFDRERYYIQLHNTVETGLNLPHFDEAPGRERGCSNPRGKDHYAYGDSNATRKAVEASVKARTGKPLSEETKQKMRDARKKNTLNAKKLRCVETSVIYPSRSEASKAVGVNPSAINSAMRKNCKAGGFHWEYV